MRSALIPVLLSMGLLATSQTPQGAGELSVAEVDSIIRAAAAAVDSQEQSVVVVDRAGRVLAVWQKNQASMATAERALSLARTGALFSHNQAPLSSRTVRYISGAHFPPGIPFQPPGALYGIENTNRGCSLNTTFNPERDVPQSLSLSAIVEQSASVNAAPLRCDSSDQRGCSPGVGTGKFTGTFSEGRFYDVPEAEILDRKPGQVHGGGIPIFKGCRLVGGIGVFGGSPDAAEFAAFTGSISGGPTFGPGACLPNPGAVYVDGIRLPFVQNLRRPGGIRAGTVAGQYLIPPAAGGSAPEGWLVGGPENPLETTLLTGGDVQQVVQQAIAEANLTRAAIRLPLGSRTRMVIAVSDLSGNLLGLYRMPDATVFSIDVAVAKSRNVVYFSKDPDPRDLPGVPSNTAVTNRTLGFVSQPFYPPGIDGSAPGPAFDLFRYDLANPCTQGHDPAASGNANGVVFFPGSLPLYKDGQLIGGLGVSGDGVDQDDVVANGGAAGFEPPASIRANEFFVGGVRLPYLKFSRNPRQ